MGGLPDVAAPHMTAAPAGSIVKLTDLARRAGGPEAGDVLETRTGRRYLILEARPQGRHRVVYACAVMAPEDEHPEGAVRFEWEWARR